VTRTESGTPTDRWAFLLPPGWARFPTGSVAGSVASSLASSGVSNGAVYVPTERTAGIAIPASITETEIFGVVGLSATEVAASLLGDVQESTAVDVDGRPGARLASTLEEVPGGAGRPAAGTRQVTYVVSRDEAEGDWLVLSFSTSWSSGPAEQLAETLVDFFDAVMTTFRWTGPGADPVNLPERTVPGSV
jgi:hypothetical protein